MNFVSTESKLTRIISLQDCLFHKTQLCFECCYVGRCGNEDSNQECDIIRKLEYDDFISTKMDELSALIRKSTIIFTSEVEKCELRRVTYSIINYKQPYNSKRVELLRLSIFIKKSNLNTRKNSSRLLLQSCLLIEP